MGATSAGKVVAESYNVATAEKANHVDIIGTGGSCGNARHEADNEQRPNRPS
jgi:hypothetical protein